MKKLIPILILIVLAFGAVSATTFTAPTTTPPTGVIVPVHTGSSQVKEGSLSVNTFIARAVAQLKQQVYINNTNLYTTTAGQKGVLRGSSVAPADNANTVVFGGTYLNNTSDNSDDLVYNTSVLSSHRIIANKFLQSGKITHDTTIAKKRSLCADADGNVVFCKVATTDVDVCTNIQGIQTNPPAGMRFVNANCEWFSPNNFLLGSLENRTTTQVYAAIGGSANMMSYLFNSNYYPDSQLTPITSNPILQERFLMAQAVCRGVGPNVSPYSVTVSPLNLSARAYGTNWPQKPSASDGDIIYDSGTNPFNGGNNWWGLLYNGTARYAVQINASGVVQASVNCLN